MKPELKEPKVKREKLELKALKVLKVKKVKKVTLVVKPLNMILILQPQLLTQVLEN